ncbi:MULTISPECIES: IMP dehydrogenase [unclassified Streptomyces]|uniref:IMP dehydrogenase n=1 Tax=unclassified Streptomyces TaxID=2593676 RepID=UPI0005A717AB|nr:MULTISPECIES: IMP dehydrogenase [unclassified Streptomyces]ODA72680.1 Inosine-5'-monophosphate dehydrogenase [Streptomyces sp. AVP053U2]
MHITTEPPTGLSFDDVLLVPQRTSLRSRRHADLTTELLPGLRLRVPVVSASTQWCTGDRMATGMALNGGIGVLHRMQTVGQQADQLRAVKTHEPSAEQRAAGASLDAAGRLAVGAAVGVTGDWRERADRMVAGGADLLVVDVAHGHSDQVLEAVAELRRAHPRVSLMAGNVATGAGTRDLADAGADLIKVGIGPGGVCTTRLVAGTGVPQLTAILDCAAEGARHGVRVVADGGIRQAGDIAKALAAGACAVMLGSLLAGAEESEALPVERDGRVFKTSRGFVSLGMELTLRRAAGERITAEEVDDYVPEGVEATFAHTGSLTRTLRQLTGGVQSALSYSGAAGLDDFRDRARFVRVTPAGQVENTPHVRARTEHIDIDHVAEAVNSEQS